MAVFCRIASIESRSDLLLNVYLLLPLALPPIYIRIGAGRFQYHAEQYHSLVESSDAMRSVAMGALVLAIGVGPFGRLQSGSMAEALTVSWSAVWRWPLF